MFYQILCHRYEHQIPSTQYVLCSATTYTCRLFHITCVSDRISSFCCQTISRILPQSCCWPICSIVQVIYLVQYNIGFRRPDVTDGHCLTWPGQRSPTSYWTKGYRYLYFAKQDLDTPHNREVPDSGVYHFFSARYASF